MTEPASRDDVVASITPGVEDGALKRGAHVSHRPVRAGWVRIVLGVTLALIVAGAVALWSLDGAQAPATGARAPAGKVPVRVAMPAREALQLTARYLGDLDADAVEISARISGLLQSVKVRIGDRVQRGQVLGAVDTAQLTRQVAEVQAARRAALANSRRVQAELDAARSELQRHQPLVEQKLISPQQVDVLHARVAALNAERAGADAQADQALARERLLQQQIKDARLIAPFDGGVAERHLDPGVVVQIGTPVLRVVREGPLRVRFRVPERELGQVRVGAAFDVTSRATADARHRGRVERISAAVSRDDRSIAVEGALEQQVPELRPGMHVEITLQLGSVEGALTISGRALVERPSPGGESSLGAFVIERGVARFQPLSVVGRSGDRVAVEGLAPDAQVIVLGQERLREASAVLVVEDGS